MSFVYPWHIDLNYKYPPSSFYFNALNLLFLVLTSYFQKIYFPFHFLKLKFASVYGCFVIQIHLKFNSFFSILHWVTHIHFRARHANSLNCACPSHFPLIFFPNPHSFPWLPLYTKKCILIILKSSVWLQIIYNINYIITIKLPIFKVS